MRFLLTRTLRTYLTRLLKIEKIRSPHSHHRRSSPPISHWDMSHAIAAPVVTFVCPRALARHTLTDNHEDRSFLPLHRHPRRWYVILVLNFDWRQRKDQKFARLRMKVVRCSPSTPPIHAFMQISIWSRWFCLYSETPTPKMAIALLSNKN